MQLTPIVLVVPGDDVEIADVLLELLEGGAEVAGAVLALHHELVAGAAHGRARLDVAEVDSVLREDVQVLGERARVVRRLRREQQPCRLG